MATPTLSTLHHVTQCKLNKLTDHWNKFEADRKAILIKVSAASDQRHKVEALLEGFKLCGITPKQADLSIANITRFVHQAKHDSSVSASLLEDWQSKLQHELNVASVRYEYADLFGKLLTEWIKHPNPAALTMSSSVGEADSDTEMSDGFDKIGRKEMHEQRKEWEKHAFTAKKVDQSKIEAYLNDIFSTAGVAKKVKKTPLQHIRDSMKKVMDFKSDIRRSKQDSNVDRDAKAPVVTERFNVDELKSCIKGVLMEDLLTGKKREALVDLENQPAVLKELVDVLNIDLDGLDKWEWHPAPVSLTMRRQLNGKYRVYMDEETHQAILLHFIGKTWSVALKRAFEEFYESSEWIKTPTQAMTKKARQRLEFFVPGSTMHSSSVRNVRRNTYHEKYFLTQLPWAHEYASEEQNEEISGKLKSPLATKQSMLRLITTELLLQTKVYGEFFVVQSDFKWFGPSLPHDTIFAVLKFFGVPEKWLRFFKKFLEVPVVFAQDGPDAQPQVRRCGIPMSHILSDALGEVLLFCLDFAVNKRTQGANIYRFHDDLWLWGQESTCVPAWNAVKEFVGVMGLALNEEKTGAALVVANEVNSRPLPPVLPQGKIKWGFLTLDAGSGRWVIDRTQVDEHVEELRRQLGVCSSVMAWVQAWNSYASRFFSNNFGQPANCLGRQHNDMIINTFEHIQRRLFPDSGVGNVTDYLRGVLKERFGVNDPVPDGFFYFPVELGGLGLRNPFINAFATYEHSLRNPGERIDRAFEEEQEAYEQGKERWDSGECRAAKRMKFGDGALDTDTETDEPFMSLAEYTKNREETSRFLYSAYEELLGCPFEESVETPADILHALRLAGLSESPYWLWIYNLYSGDLKRRFGGQGLQLGERDLLPVGLVEVLKSEKVRWEG